MKAKKTITTAIIFLLFLTLQSCIHIRMTSEIHRDGSITKTIALEGSRENIMESAPFQWVNSTWDTVWTDIDKDQSKFIASKKFTNCNELNRFMNPDDTTQIRFRSKAELKRKFRWFFSYFEYTETIAPLNPFQQVDWRDYLTEKEIHWIGMDEDEFKADSLGTQEDYDQIEKKLENYLIESMFTDIHQLVVQSLKKNHAPDSLIQQVLTKRDDIRDFLVESGDVETASELVDLFDKFFGQDQINKWVDLTDPQFDLFDQKMKIFNKLLEDDYAFDIRMPGLLMNTNSETVEGNECQWNPDVFDFFFTEYVMKAETRLINQWAFIVSGIILLIAISGLVLLAKRAKK